MREHWRLVQTGYMPAAMNMAVDQAILVAHSKGLVPPTVRFYGWKPPAISIGYFQGLTEEVDLDSCRRYGVDYVRRVTGGGAVFHDQELTYSIVISETHPQMSKNILESYGRICGAIIKGLNMLGITATYAPINDILVDGKKISGNAQTRKFGVVLQHGTILLDVDVEKMFSLLKVPSEKIKDKLISDVKQRVTSVHHVLGRIRTFEQVAQAMKHGFETEFSVLFEEQHLTPEEKTLAEKFKKEYFSDSQWNFKR
ncbi:MAG: biotin/lipoate A/B protein ligase family protein [Candidatus Thermoplasmatota archaeon]